MYMCFVWIIDFVILHCSEQNLNEILVPSLLGGSSETESLATLDYSHLSQHAELTFFPVSQFSTHLHFFLFYINCRATQTAIHTLLQLLLSNSQLSDLAAAWAKLWKLLRQGNRSKLEEQVFNKLASSWQTYIMHQHHCLM